MATEFHNRRRRLEPGNGVTCHNRHAGRRLVYRDDRQIRKCVLRLSFVYFRRRNRRICFDRFIFLLCISRASANSHIFVNRNLGERKSCRGGVEDHDLSGNWQFHLVAWADPALSKRSGCFAQLRYSHVDGSREPGANRSGSATPHLPAATNRIRNSDFAFPVPYLGAGSVRVGSGTRGDVARRCVKKIRVVWLVASGYSSLARRRTSLDQSARGAAAREHHLRRTGYNRSEAARLDARLLERHAHGLHFSRNCQRQRSWRDWRCCLDVRAWTFNRAAVCDCRGTPQTH